MTTVTITVRVPVQLGTKTGWTQSYSPRYKWVSVRWDDGGSGVYGIATFGIEWCRKLNAALKMAAA